MGRRWGRIPPAILMAVALAAGLLVGVGGPSAAAGLNDLVLQLTTPSPNTTVEMPLTGVGTNVTITWGDSTSTGPLTSGSMTTQSHVYAAAGSYSVRVSATLLTGFGSPSPYQGVDTITAVTQFGNLGITAMSGAFRGATHLVNVPTSLPSTVTTMASMFEGATLLNDPDIALWNTANVTDMSALFKGASAFNQAIGGWNTATVTNMEKMFMGASTFNRPLGGWNTGSVTSMYSMFSQASAFNQPIGTWNTSKVHYTSYMFDRATSFNQPIGTWTTSEVTDMTSMFEEATSFNQPVATWDTSSVVSMSLMFHRATAFNRPVGTWDTSSLTYIDMAFDGASSFNQSLASWDISKVTEMNYLLDDTHVSVANYDALLVAWAGKAHLNGLAFAARTRFYSSAGQVGRTTLTSAPSNWTITDGGLAFAPGIAAATITGSATVGQVLTANLSGVTGGPLPDATYRWQSRLGSGPWETIVGAVSRSVTLPDATVGRAVRVVATMSNGVLPTASASSAPTSAVAVGAPTAPRTVVASPRTSSAVVTWLAPVRTGGRVIDRYVVVASPGGRSCITLGALTCTVTGLTDGVTYRFSVRARNSLPLIGPSSALSAGIVAGTPSEPRTLSVAFPSAGKATVSWTSPLSAGSAPITAYLVRWLPAGSTTWTAWTSTTLPTASRTGLLRLRVQRVEVRARNLLGYGPSASLSFVQMT